MLIKRKKTFSTRNHVEPVLFKAETKLTLKLCLCRVRMKHHLLNLSVLLFFLVIFHGEKNPIDFLLCNIEPNVFMCHSKLLKVDSENVLVCTCVLLALQGPGTIASVCRIKQDLPPCLT